MFILFTIVHVIVSLVLILVVLLQSGKAGDLASAFGGVGSQTAFGARGAATILTKATTVCAILFMATSLALAIMLSRDSDPTVMEAVPSTSEPYVDPYSGGPAETTEDPVLTEPSEPASGETSEQSR